MYEKFVKLLVEELQIDESEITMDAELSNDLGINSIELADLVMQCEDTFGIEIQDDDIRQFSTVRDVVTYLESIA
jgi:acyl carrier protein